MGGRDGGRGGRDGGRGGRGGRRGGRGGGRGGRVEGGTLNKFVYCTKLIYSKLRDSFAVACVTTESIKLDHQSIKLDHQSIKLDHQSIKLDHLSPFLKGERGSSLIDWSVLHVYVLCRYVRRCAREIYVP